MSDQNPDEEKSNQKIAMKMVRERGLITLADPYTKIQEAIVELLDAHDTALSSLRAELTKDNCEERLIEENCDLLARIVSLKAERDALKAEVKKLDIEHQTELSMKDGELNGQAFKIQSLEDDRNEYKMAYESEKEFCMKVMAERDNTKKALKNFGLHHAYCNVVMGVGCDCGFDEALNATEEKEESK